MREFEGDTTTIRSAAAEVRALGLDVEAVALATAPALRSVGHDLDGSAVGDALGAASPAVAAVLGDLTTALTTLATGLHRAAEEYELAEQRQVTRFTASPPGR